MLDRDVHDDDPIKNEFTGVHESPNIQGSAATYEIENHAADPDMLIEGAMRRIASWDGKVVLDLGSGTGFHIPRFHALATLVFAVEPHGMSHLLAMRRASQLGLERASFVRGSAEEIPLRDSSVDIVHARFAYFFGAGSEKGLSELHRVIRPGGTAFIVDNDLHGGTFAEWLLQVPEWSDVDPDEEETYFRKHGFEVERIRSEWSFASRDDLERVVRLEFPDKLADTFLDSHDGLRVSYWYLLMHKQY